MNPINLVSRSILSNNSIARTYTSTSTTTRLSTLWLKMNGVKPTLPRTITISSTPQTTSVNTRSSRSLQTTIWSVLTTDASRCSYKTASSRCKLNTSRTKSAARKNYKTCICAAIKVCRSRLRKMSARTVKRKMPTPIPSSNTGPSLPRAVLQFRNSSTWANRTKSSIDRVRYLSLRNNKTNRVDHFHKLQLKPGARVFRSLVAMNITTNSARRRYNRRFRVTLYLRIRWQLISKTLCMSTEQFRQQS